MDQPNTRAQITERSATAGSSDFVIIETMPPPKKGRGDVPHPNYLVRTYQEIISREPGYV